MMLQAVDESEKVSARAALRAEIDGTNVNPRTFLATDYLNHFNEIVMLLELGADVGAEMPECLVDALEWRPLSYAEHFEKSNLSDAEIAVRAYELAPEDARIQFDAITEEMTRLAVKGLGDIGDALAGAEPARAAAKASELAEALRDGADRASAVVHGSEETGDQAAIDAMFGDESGEANGSNQAAIDALFG